MRKIARPLGVALLALSFSGCVARIFDFTALSTKSANIPGERGPRVQGEDIATIIVFVPNRQATIKAAIDDALQQSGGDVLIDGVISQRCWYVPFIIGKCGYIVEGTPVKLEGSFPPAPAEPQQ